MTPTERADVAVLMPLASIIAVGAGTQGQAALATWGGLVTPEFEPGFSELLQAVQADPESSESVPYLRDVAAVAARAHAWIHITSHGLTDERTYVVLQAPSETVVVGIHGDIVEWVVGGHDVLSRCLSSLLDSAHGAVVLLTCFDATSAFAGLRFAEGNVEVTAADRDVFEALTSAAHDGLDSLGLVLATLASTGVLR